MDIFSKAIRRQVSCDVLVIGGGSAGCCAALAAARSGARVALVERYGFLGGISTQVLDTFYGFYTPGTKAIKVVGGVMDEVVAELQKRKMVLRRPNTYGAGDGITYDPETLKTIWEQLALQAGVQLHYHTLVLDAIREQNQVVGVVAGSKDGLVEFRAGAVVDASGDADVAAAAGASYDSAAGGAKMQSLTTTFRVANVDGERAQNVPRREMERMMSEAVQHGYRLPRREGSIHVTPLRGVMAANLTRVADVDATDPQQLTAAEIEGRRQALEYVRFLHDCVPGYENAVLINLSTQIGIRESRRVHGDYWLTREDVLSARDFPDTIARCGAPIEDHHAGSDTRWEYLPNGATYGIPYRCLLPRNVDGLLVAGRCLSASHDAHASVRSMGQCMAMGQAAGVAAAMSAASQTMPRDVDVAVLQDRLRGLGALI
jgi:glycine/D-amino acid oxidase-like deaminating enzyme